MLLKIEVTKEDIEKGEPEAAYACPVALAVKRAAPLAIAVSVSGLIEFKYLNQDGDKCKHSIQSPKVVNDFTDSFDKLDDTEPFSFELDIHDEVAAFLGSGH